MFKSVLIGVLVAVLLPVGGSVAAADPDVPDVVQYKDFDGWRMSLEITDITIESVPNIAATATTREGFVTARATEYITRLNGDEATADTKLTDDGSSLTLKAVTGCQWDASDGLTISPDPFVVGPNVGTTLTPGADNPASIGLGETPLGDQGAQLFSWKVKPGTIEDAFKYEKSSSPMDESEKTRRLIRVISVEKEPVDKQNCGGPVAIRLQAHATMKTSQSDSYLTVYSNIRPL